MKSTRKTPHESNELRLWKIFGWLGVGFWVPFSGIFICLWLCCEPNEKKEIIRQNNAQNHALTKLIATNTHNLYAVPFFHLWSFRGIFNGVSKYFSIFQTKTSGIFCSTFFCIRAPLLSCFSIAIPLLWNISPIFFSSSRLHFISNR